MLKGIMLKKCKKNKAYIICSSLASSFNTAGMSLTDRLSSDYNSHLSCPFLPPCRSSYSSLLIYNISFMSRLPHLSLFSSLIYPSVSFPERHTPRLRRVSSAPCGALNSGTDFSFVGFHSSTPSLPDARKVIPAAYSFPRYGRGVVAAA